MRKRRLGSRLRIQFLGLFMLLGVGSLAVRLWWIQVAHGQEWTSQIRGSSQATVRIPSVRGEIKDRNGLTLVQNRASYEVDFYLPEMVKGYRERFGSPPTSEYRAIISGMPKDMKEPDIIKIVEPWYHAVVDDPDNVRLLQVFRHTIDGCPIFSYRCRPKAFAIPPNHFRQVKINLVTGAVLYERHAISIFNFPPH